MFRSGVIAVGAISGILLGLERAVACPVCPSAGGISNGGAELPFVMLAFIAGGFGVLRLGQRAWRRRARRGP